MEKTIYYAIRTSRNDWHYFIGLFEVVDGEIKKVGFCNMPATMDPDWELLVWLKHNYNSQKRFNFKLKELKLSAES